MTGCSNMPTGCKEFISRFGKIVGSATQFFRIGQHHQRTLGKHALHRFHIIDQCGKQRFHAFDRNGVGNGFKHVFGVWNGADQGFRTHAHLFGQLQLTAWRGPDHRNVTAIRTLVGCMEFLDGIDFVTEEFDRTGCGNVGGNTSIMPPRTANSPRSITKSTRVYAFSTSRCDASSSANSSPWENTSAPHPPSPQPQAESGNAPA